MIRFATACCGRTRSLRPKARTARRRYFQSRRRRPNGRNPLPSIHSAPPSPPESPGNINREMRPRLESRAFARRRKRLMTGETFAPRRTRTVMTARSSLTVVLAAGEGTRMRSSLPKVLHPVAGQSLLAHVLDAAPKGDGASLAVVVGPDHQAVADEARRARGDATTFIQRERLGTAHAVLAAREAVARGADDLLVVFGDTPLISAETFARLRAPLAKGAAIAALGF